MGKLSVAGLASLLAISCGGDAPGNGTDAGGNPVDPCRPLDEVGICPSRGIYDAPVDVELRAPESGDTIHYTVDGTQPDENSLVHAGGQLLVRADPSRGGVRTLRAIAVHTDGSRTTPVTHSYVFPSAVLDQPEVPAGHPETWGFGDNTRVGDYQMDARILATTELRSHAANALGSIATVALTLEHRDLWAPASGIYMRPSASGADFVRPATVEILEPDGKSRTAIAGVSMQGNSSVNNWKAAKLSLRLRFEGVHGSGALGGKLFADSELERFDNLVLDAHLNNTWIHPEQVQRARSLYAHDQFVSKLMQAAGGHAPHHRPVHLYLNGLYWGLYDLHERPDDHFAASYFGGNAEEWDVLRHQGTELVAGELTAWDQMIAIARAGLDNPTRYQEIAELLDIDGFIAYMLVNFYAGNDDWDLHNWYAARRREPGAGFLFISWDAERVLGDVDIDVTSAFNANAPTELYAALLENADFRARVSDGAQNLFGAGGPLYVDAASPAWDENAPQNNQPAALFFEVTESLRPHILLESARWGDNRAEATPYSVADWDRVQSDLLSDFFPLRSGRAAGQL